MVRKKPLRKPSKQTSFRRQSARSKKQVQKQKPAQKKPSKQTSLKLLGDIKSIELLNPFARTGYLAVLADKLEKNEAFETKELVDAYVLVTFQTEQIINHFVRKLAQLESPVLHVYKDKVLTTIKNLLDLAYYKTKHDKKQVTLQTIDFLQKNLRPVTETGTYIFRYNRQDIAQVIAFKKLADNVDIFIVNIDFLSTFLLQKSVHTTAYKDVTTGQVIATSAIRGINQLVQAVTNAYVYELQAGNVQENLDRNEVLKALKEDFVKWYEETLQELAKKQETNEEIKSETRRTSQTESKKVETKTNNKAKKSEQKRKKQIVNSLDDLDILLADL